MIDLKVGEAQTSSMESWAAIAGHASSTITTLAWPVALVIVVFAFKKELRALLDRLQSADVAGNKVTFSEKLAVADATISEVAGEIVGLASAPVLDAAAPDGAVPADALFVEPQDQIQYLDQEQNRNEKTPVEQKPLPEPRTKIIQNIGSGKSYNSLAILRDLSTDTISRSEYEGAHARIIVEKAWKDLYSVIKSLFRKRYPNNASSGINTITEKLFQRGHISSEIVATINQLHNLAISSGAGRSRLNMDEAQEFVRTAKRMTALLSAMSDLEEAAPPKHP
ncbi:hypothetical protein ACN2C6_18890 [Caulobacter sp. ErkDOM-YI]|uniref:hypothetical protein n=1 Tax=unclassified Caulobacter TaxID=2648921 RepID=UPI003AF79873